LPILVSPVNHARVFVGSDRSQLLAVKVLEHSIKRHTDMAVTVRSMHDLDLPDPKDIRQGKRTGFSFTRFAIPELAGHQGRALYLDADMLVFRDLREIYDLPFGAAKVIIQEELPQVAQAKKPGSPEKRINQCSVMMLDCERLGWRSRDIIAGLDGRYTYEDLMFHLCVLEPHEVAYAIPFQWNSLETYEPERTGLIHYTDMSTQPWVTPDNANGYLWLEEVRLMISAGELTRDELKVEIDLGYFRPSLLAELDLGLDRPPSPVEAVQLRRIDQQAGYEPHREVMEQRRKRQAAVKAYEAGPMAPTARAVNWPRAVLTALRQRLRA
jgi:hypothetical protein